MSKLLKPNWLQNMVTEEEVNNFNPEGGPCCDISHFRVHLEGTTCNSWNKSATDVFVKGFLAYHAADYKAEDQSVRDMVQLKSQAALDSMIREYRRLKAPRTPAEVKERQRYKNRLERKRKVIPTPPTLSSPMLTNSASFIIAAGRLRGYYHLSNIIVPFWSNSGQPGCPVMRRKQPDFPNNMKSSYLPGGLR